MESKNYKIALLAACAWSAPSIHAQESETGFDASILIETRYDTNANRVPAGEASLKERQGVYTLDVGYSHVSSNVNFDGGYRIFYEEYAEDSQDSDTNFAGNSGIVLGTETSLFGLTAEHGLSRVLQSPENEDTTANLTDREDLSFTPHLRLRPSKVDSILISTAYSQTEFEDFQRNNTSTLSTSVHWEHDISATQSAGLILTQHETEFDDNPTLDYEYRALGLTYTSEQRALSYALQAGVNEIKPKEAGDAETSVFYSADIEYETPTTVFLFKFNQELTDTGNKNSLADPTSETGIAGDLQVQDRIDWRLYQFELVLKSVFGCVRCEARGLVESQELQYLNLDVNDNDVMQFLTSFSYRISSQSLVKASYQDRSVTYENNAARDVDIERYRFAYERRVGRDIDIALFYEYYQQEQEVREYDYDRFGASLRYEFR